MEQHTPVSKFISYILRHRPDSIGVEMDSAGWVVIDELIEKSNTAGKSLTREILIGIVCRAIRRDDSKDLRVFVKDHDAIQALHDLPLIRRV